MIYGTVKWARDDGTGYVTDQQGNTYFTDASVCLSDWDAMEKGVAVRYDVKAVLGKVIAVDVRIV